MRVIEILKRANDKLEPVSDSVLTYIESLSLITWRIIWEKYILSFLSLLYLE